MSSSSEVTPLVSQGSRVGPVFCMKDKCAFVKVSNTDEKRAVINMTSMTLVQYANIDECPVGALLSDQSLFVPIFCKECYGTNEDDYIEALASIVSCGSDRFLVGTCSVFGVAQGEVYPESRKDFIVSNDMSYSGACHPQPAKAVFLHDVKKDIGRVKCYWHVHSRSVEKTFLFCCVACRDDEYTNGVLGRDMSMGLSLGTVGNNKIGPVTVECSLVSVPMRPGCFCTLVPGKDLRLSMIRMGFSTLKDSVLDAGCVNLKESSVIIPDTQTEPSYDVSHESSEGQSITETVRFLRKAVLDQAAEVQVLKDVLEAIKVQNSVLTQRLTCPTDPDTLFTMQGAKDFTRRTGVKTKLCAGITPTDDDTNLGVTDPTTGHPTPMPEEIEDTMATVTQTQIDNLIKLLQQPALSQLLQQPDLPQQQQYQPLQAQLQAQLQALQNCMQLAPLCQQFTQPQTQHLWNQQQSGQGSLFGKQFSLNPSGVSTSGGDKPFQCGNLTEAQRRMIAMEYNKEESERQAAFQKEQDKMLDSIKAGVRDVILEHQRSSVSQESNQSNQSNMDTLQRLARDIPYKRVCKQADVDQDPGEIATLMKELRKLTKQISKCGSGGSREESGEVGTMDTGEAGGPTCSTSDTQSSVQQSNTDVTNKQQAGYTAASSGGSDSLKTPTSVSEFISAVVSKM